MRMIKPARLAVVASACAVLAGCAVKAPLPSSWTVVGRGQAPAAALAKDGPALAIARCTAAAEVRTTDLTWRSDDGRQLNRTDDRWVDYPDRMLEDLARETLLASGRFASVNSVPSPVPVDAVLQVRVLDFTEWHAEGGTEVRVAIEWRLRRGTGEPLGQDIVRTAAPLAEKSVAGAVRAYQAASDDAMKRLIEAIVAATSLQREG